MKQIQFIQSIRAWMDIFMQRSMRGWWRFAKSTGLSIPQFSIMMQMHHRGACAMSEVSERFEITPAAASQLVDKLVQSGFIMRREDPNDRRAKLLDLTDKGRDLIQQGIEERYRWVNELAEKLTPAERIQISEALDIMTRAARDLEAEPVH
ncbi:MAG TPA: MarR family transcriptional regulator [Anaerolineales bacterium]|nr:MarR family transcriptional regulator [Anaerolineales bacterium]